MVASYDESVLDAAGIVQAVEKAGYGAFLKTPAGIQEKSRTENRTAKPEISTAQAEYKQMKQRLLLSAVLYFNGAYDGLASARLSAGNGKRHDLCLHTVPFGDSCGIYQFQILPDRL